MFDTLTQNHIVRIFQHKFKGRPNFMTPETHSYGQSTKNKHLIYEISEGAGLRLGSTIVGVTVLELEFNKRGHIRRVSKAINKSKSFVGSNRQLLIKQAQQYGQNLK